MRSRSPTRVRPILLFVVAAVLVLTYLSRSPRTLRVRLVLGAPLAVVVAVLKLAPR
jgi:hypothetical protein